VPILSAYADLPFYDQMLHGFHFMLCCFAVLVALIPLLTEKGSAEHKLAGLVYLPLSLVALTLASYMAWRESSAVLFCFNCFCAYLLMSGWRAVHESETPDRIDWMIPVSLFALAIGVTVHALLDDQGMRSFYLLFFALNAFYLAWRDVRHLRQRAYWAKHKNFFADSHFGAAQPASWLGRHIAGMVGSMLANLSVVILTLLPLEWHWVWPVSLIFLSGYVAQKEQQKRQQIRKALAVILQPKFKRDKPLHARDNQDIRRAA
jgi:uncharacterized membrane protein YfcA